MIKDSGTGWKERALLLESNPKAIEVLKNGPKKLTDAWMLQALKLKYQIRGTNEH